MNVAVVVSLVLAIAPAARANPAVWERLRTADQAYFVLMRHTLAPGTGDPAAFDLNDCATQRNFSADEPKQSAQGQRFDLKE